MSGIITATVVVAAVGLFIGVFLGIAAIKFQVETDPKEEAVLALLPGNNCGGCGYAGCSGMAEALVTGEVNATAPCKPCKKEQRDAIVAYLKETPGPNGETVTLRG